MSVETFDITECLDPAVLVELTQVVWASFVDPELSLEDLTGHETAFDADALVGGVDISGPFCGRVSVFLPGPAATAATAAMFDMPAAEVTAADVHDAAGEITNMIGGNVKAILPGEHRLGLPSVTSPTTCDDPSVSRLMSATLLWGEHLLLVTLDRTAGGAP